MNSVPIFGSPSIADPDSKLNWRSIQNTPDHQSANADIAATSEVIVERQIIEISAEAHKKYNDELQKMGALTPEELAKQKVLDLKDPDVWNAIQKKDRDEYSKKLDSAAKALAQATSQIYYTYLSFMEKLAIDNPDLKGASFGFSVNKNGTLMVTESEGLTPNQTRRLEKALNSSGELVKQANNLANAQIADFDIENEGASALIFNRDNYAQTIDIGKAIQTRHLASITSFDFHDQSTIEIYRKSWDYDWRQQLARNGVPKPTVT
ncbi:hypothetical protein NMX13_18950 [Dickeya zeae]|nr:hypothetical protein NMX13_18950 [Dickeya zeae]